MNNTDSVSVVDQTEKVRSGTGTCRRRGWGFRDGGKSGERTRDMINVSRDGGTCSTLLN